MKYLLMNKNIEIAEFDLEGGYSVWANGMMFAVGNLKVLNGKLPYDRFSKMLSKEDCLANWINNRCGANHNHRVNMAMVRAKITDHDRFLKATHAASLNDTFWIKGCHEDISWEEISLYRKDFSKGVADYCLGFRDDIPSNEDFTNCPEFVTNGSFRRGFEKREDGIYLTKRSSGYGYESACEVLSSSVMAKFCPDNYVPYSLIKRTNPRNDKIEYLSVCKFFTDEDTGMVTYYNLADEITLFDDILVKFMKEHNCEEDFARMVLADCFICNTDRHLNNFGFLMDNDSLEIKGFAPVFDLNLSLFPEMNRFDFEGFTKYVKGFKPRFGSDFTKMGHRFVTWFPKLKSLVEEMSEFKFDISPEMEELLSSDKTFDHERIAFLEEMIHTQSKAILSEEEKTFSQAMYHDETDLERKKKELKLSLSKARTFERAIRLSLENTEFAAFLDNISYLKTDDYIAIVIDDPELKGQATINFTTNSISFTGKQFPEEVVNLIYAKTDIWFVDAKTRIERSRAMNK